MASVTVAGIDCGTNSIRLKVARVDEHGMEEIVPRTLRVIRLGQDVDQTHRFADEALERAYAAAGEFAEILREHPVDGIRFVATSATRDAENREQFEDAMERILGVRPEVMGEFAEILREHPVDGIRFVATSATRDAENREQFEDAMERILGVRPEVIPGTEEADLSFLGATSVVERDLEAPYVVIDLGGGSTELVLGGDGVTAPKTEVQAAFSMNIGTSVVERDLEAPYVVIDLGGGSTELVLGGDGVTAPKTEVQAAFSMNIGSVRMTERHLHTDPPTDDEIAEAIADIDEHIDEAFRVVPAGKARTIIGVSGTVTTMTALTMGLKEYDHRLVDGVRVPFPDAFAVNDRFLRCAVPGRVRRQRPVPAHAA